jgi:tetratricopeptide (TPR) repeat protein
MKLTVFESVKDLTALELGEVNLFFDNNKSVSLIIREDNSPQLLVKLKNDLHYFSLNERDKAQELFDKAFVIDSDIYKNNDRFIEFIKNCEAGVRYKLSDGKRSIEIDVKSDGTYSWTYGYEWLHFYPMKNKDYIKTFKTDMGARLSLIRYLNLNK